MALQEVSLDDPLSGLRASNLLIETEVGRAIVRRTRRKSLHKLVSHLPDGRRTTLTGVPEERSLRQAAASLTGARPLRAFLLPPGGEVVAKLRPVSTVLHYLPWVAGVGLLWAALANPGLGTLRVVFLALGITVVIIARDAFAKSRRYRDWAFVSKAATTKAIDYVLPGLPEEIEVDDVKVEYGRLLSDIVYRIECPALFDPHEPTSKEFTLALLQWDNNDGVAGQDERRELARRVRATFAAARANAERIGMDHLPAEARDRAGTALKAARLATDEAAPEPERQAALGRAVEILDQLALYYLPTGAQARRAITGSAPPQLPGRRN